MFKSSLNKLNEVGTMFYFNLLKNLKSIPTENVDVMGTDGINVFYNPETLSLKSEIEVEQLLKTVALQISLKHVAQLNIYNSTELSVDKKAVNIASFIDSQRYLHNQTDFKKEISKYNIDPVLASSASLFQLYNNFFTIEDNEDKDGSNDIGEIPPNVPTLLSNNDVQSMEDIDPKVRRRLATPNKTAIDDLVSQATNYDDDKLPKSCTGTEPSKSSEINKYTRTNVMSSLDAKKYLRKKLKQDIKSEIGETSHSYSKLRRRFLPSIYLPSEVTKTQMCCTILLDVSGSISKNQLNIFMSETENIIKTMGFDKVRILTFNTKIVLDTYISSVKQFRELTIDISGGTCLIQAFKHLKNTLKPNYKNTLIVFSDLECDEVPLEYKTLFNNVIYFCYDNKYSSAKFGHLINLTSK